MAITHTLLTEGSDGDGGATCTTASFTTVAGRLTLLAICSQPTGSDENPTLTTDSAGRSWTAFTPEYFYYDNASSGSAMKLYGTTDAGTGTCLFTYPGTQPDICWSVSEFPGCTGVRSIQTSAQNDTGLSPHPTSNLPSFLSVNNGTYMFTALADSGRSFTPGTGFTEISDFHGTGFAQAIHTQWRTDNDTTPDATISGAGTPHYGVIALELIAGATGPVLSLATVTAITATTATPRVTITI